MLSERSEELFRRVVGGQYTCGFGEGVHALMHPSQGKVAAGHKTHTSQLEFSAFLRVGRCKKLGCLWLGLGVNQGSWGLKLNIQKNKIMASGPITSWQIDGETVADFTFWGSKITADGD